MYSNEAAEEVYDQLLDRLDKTGELEGVLALHIFTRAYKCQVPPPFLLLLLLLEIIKL
jgi:hypothetical protein